MAKVFLLHKSGLLGGRGKTTELFKTKEESRPPSIDTSSSSSSPTSTRRSENTPSPMQSYLQPTTSIYALRKISGDSFGSQDSGFSGSPKSCVTEDLNEFDNKATFNFPCSEPIREINENFQGSMIDELEKHFQQSLRSSETPPSALPTPAPSCQTSPKIKRLLSTDVSTPVKKRKIKIKDKTSPISGTIIRDSDDEDGEVTYTPGDIDSELNLVVVTDETRAEIAKIENKIGDYGCRLCGDDHEDVFQLAQHRCPRIVHIEYRCSVCAKVFNCPANLASHKRWHKPRAEAAISAPSAKPAPVNKAADRVYACQQCEKTFRRPSYLRKHELTHVDKAAKNSDHLNADQRTPTQHAQYTTSPNFTHPNPVNQTIQPSMFLPRSINSFSPNMTNLQLRQMQNHQTPSECVPTNYLRPQSTSIRATAFIDHSEPSAFAEQTIVCPLCSETLTDLSKVEQHVRDMHMNREIECQYCSESFVDNMALATHTLKAHPQEYSNAILINLARSLVPSQFLQSV